MPGTVAHDPSGTAGLQRDRLLEDPGPDPTLTPAPAESPGTATVAVVLVDHDPDRLEQCLLSLAEAPATNLMAAVTVHVIGIGTGDGFADRVAAHHPRAQVTRLRLPSSRVRAANVGISAAVEAGADHVLLVDPAGPLPPGLVDTLTALMHHHPQVGILGPLHPGGMRPEVTFRHLGDRPLWYLMYAIYHPLFVAVRPRLPAPDQRGEIGLGVVLARSATVRRIGLLHEAYGSEYAVTDWCRRAGLHQWRAAFTLERRPTCHSDLPDRPWREPAARRRHRLALAATDPRLPSNQIAALTGTWLRDGMVERLGPLWPDGRPTLTPGDLVWLARHLPDLKARRRHLRAIALDADGARRPEAVR